jgi:hypothetical protein
VKGWQGIAICFLRRSGTLRTINWKNIKDGEVKLKRRFSRSLSLGGSPANQKPSRASPKFYQASELTTTIYSTRIRTPSSAIERGRSRQESTSIQFENQSLNISHRLKTPSRRAAAHTAPQSCHLFTTSPTSAPISKMSPKHDWA